MDSPQSCAIFNPTRLFHGRWPLHAEQTTQNGDKILDNQETQLTFDCASFLANAGLVNKIVELEPNDTFFSQGDPANTVFYLRSGRAKLTVVSQAGKEATITLLSEGNFVGEGALASIPGLRLSTASAVSSCVALKITRQEMARVMHDEPMFADLFSNSFCRGACESRPISWIGFLVPAKSA